MAVPAAIDAAVDDDGGAGGGAGGGGAGAGGGGAGGGGGGAGAGGGGAAAGAGAAAQGDKSLPDASPQARVALLVLLVLAVVVAIVMNSIGLANKAWSPPKGDFNFALFAGFYAGAQIIERLMELVAPLLPAWPQPGATGEV